MAGTVTITEVALRDGLQNEAATLSTATKVDLARQLAAAGISSLEVGAFVRPDAVPQLADTDTVVGILGQTPKVTRHALVFNRHGATRALDCGVDSVRLVVSATEGHSRANAGSDVATALDRIQRCAEPLTAAGIALEAAVATAFVCPFDGQTLAQDVAELATALTELGATRIYLADTIGAAHPGQIEHTLDVVKATAPQIELGLHLHNTYGMALANALTGYRWGIRHFDAALGGLGGCPFAPGAAGNIATDDLIHMFHHLGIDTGIDPAALSRARELLRTAIGRPLDSALSAVPATPAARPMPAYDH